MARLGVLRSPRWLELSLDRAHASSRPRFGSSELVSLEGRNANGIAQWIAIPDDWELFDDPFLILGGYYVEIEPAGIRHVSSSLFAPFRLARSSFSHNKTELWAGADVAPNLGHNCG